MLTIESFIVKENNEIVEKEIEVYTNCDIPDGVQINFLSKNEIVEDLYNRVLTDTDKDILKKNNDVHSIQESIGKFIRQKYGLWLNPHPYSNNSNLSADNFADNISLEIIKRLQDKMKL